MQEAKVCEPAQIIQKIITARAFYPNNDNYPLIIYKQAIDIHNISYKAIQALLTKNNWINSWVDGIYDYHHYHSNTHETLVIVSGECKVLIGGEAGEEFLLAAGDVIILPAGVSHKKIKSSEDFKCIGSYPFDIKYDMKYGKEEEYAQAIIKIKKVGLPVCDPLYGKEGFLFKYWK